uniref:hypothetical protein n=1 Tax=uncultured Chryseobacterium sp. TaxID=259322 RepID=UPI0027DDC860
FYLRSLIEHEFDNIAGIRKNSITEIFGSHDYFENKILDNIEDNIIDNGLKEFKDFYYKVKENNWNTVDYDFKFFSFYQGY